MPAACSGGAPPTSVDHARCGRHLDGTHRMPYVAHRHGSREGVEPAAQPQLPAAQAARVAPRTFLPGAGTERRPRALHRRPSPKGAGHMATDYDTPRRTDESELGEDSIEELKARRAEAQAGTVDVDETDLAESLELPGADLSGEELTVRVLPRQADEFTCSRCFLVHHRSQLAMDKGGQLVCRECAA